MVDFDFRPNYASYRKNLYDNIIGNEIIFNFIILLFST